MSTPLSPEIQEAIKAAVAEFKAKQKDIDTFITESKSVLETSGNDAKQAAQKADDLASKLKDQADRLLDLEQKLADGVTRGKEAPKTLGQFLIESEGYKNFASGSQGKARVEIKNTIIGQDGAGNNVDVFAPNDRLPGIVPGAFRQLTVVDALPSGSTSSNAIEFTQELAFTNDAAETAEGAAKPESDITFTLKSAPVRTIAHWIKLSKQVMEDAPALQSYVDVRLRYGVELRKDTQILKGNGTGQNISGMINTGNFTAFTPQGGDTAIDSINRAIYAVWAADYAPTAMILSPADWGAIEREKGTDDHYVIGNPAGGGTLMRNLWGVPVIISNAMTAGKFVLGAFNIAYQVWNRSGTVVEMSESDDTNFTTNLITVRAECRCALAAYRPASVQYGDLTL